PLRCANPQQPASCIQPERPVVVTYRGVDKGAWKAVVAVQTADASVPPAVESTIRREPDAAIRINRQTVPGDGAVASCEPNDNVGFPVLKARELAVGIRDPNAVMLIGGKEICFANDRINRNVLDDAPVPGPKQMGRLAWRHGDRQRPDVAVAI